jgi:gamma-glutamylputrescine oxidase
VGAAIWYGDGSDLPLPSLPEGDTGADAGVVEADLCVVGLGASGLAAVHAALDRGLSVVGVDAAGVAAGAAGRNAGFALAGLAEFHHDAVARLGRERAAAAYRLTLDELARTPGVARVGSLRIAADEREAEDCKLQLHALRADDLPVEWYEGPEGVGLLLPTDGVLHPVARCVSLAAAAIERGARLFAGVSWPSPRVRAAATVVAVDGGLEDVLPELAGRVRTTRLQVLATAPTSAVRVPRPVYRRYGYDYWQQRVDGSVVVGGCRDLFATSEWGAPASPSDEVQACIESRLLRGVIGVPADVPVVARWAGRVAYTDDRLPVIEEVRPRVVACGAYSGTGNIVGVLAGRAAVELLCDGHSPVAEVLAGPA